MGWEEIFRTKVIMVDEVKCILLSESPGEKMYIQVEKLGALLGEPTTNYDALMVIDGGKKGFRPFFEQCKAEGILR